MWSIRMSFVAPKKLWPLTEIDPLSVDLDLAGKDKEKTKGRKTIEYNLLCFNSSLWLSATKLFSFRTAVIVRGDFPLSLLTGENQGKKLLYILKK